MLPSDYICPKCSNELTLEENEQIKNQFHCPKCECFIDCSKVPPKIFDPAKYKKFTVTINQGDIALIKSILDGEGIDYFILGEKFLTMDPLIQGAQIYVLSSDYDKAQKLLINFNPNIFGVSFKTS